MTTLIEFLSARIAEDEEDAGELQTQALALGLDVGHLVAEAKAKRDILKIHEPWVGGPQRSSGYVSVGGNWQTAGSTTVITPDMCGHYPCRTLLALTAVYADHPDYREEWRP